MVIFDCERSVPVPTSDAVAAAEALGLSGDPRFAGGRPVDPWVRIPAGEFIMGAQRHDPHGVGYDSEAADNEGPVHTVRLDGYAIGRYPVTVREYQEFVESAEYADARWWPSSGKPRWDAPTYWDGQKEYPTRPVIGVSWFEAAAFASWRGCRLPTEAEWERSARGREGRRFPWGDGAPNEQLLNFNQSRGHPTPVGVYPRGATPEGALDMAGNVWEWCVQGTGASTVDPQTFPTGSKTETARRVVRGGGFYDYAGWCRSACRRWSEPGLRLGDLGFRLAAGRGTGTSKQKRLRRAGARPSIRNLARIEPT